MEKPLSLYVERRPDTRPGLGRHIGHDSRSLQYLVPETVTNFTPVKWVSGAPVLDQGNVGACTGFATAGCLNHYRKPGQPPLTNADALAIYSAATRLDSIPGSYPPTDTGSDGLSAAKAAKSLGLVSGYLHVTTSAALASALTLGPVIVGTDWYESMFHPDSAGNVTVDQSAKPVGGHEYTLDEVTSDGRFGFTNSWGTSFGVGGRFYMPVSAFLGLLAAKGDATHLVPVDVPAPTPTPPAAIDPDTLAAYNALKVWAKRNNVA